MDWREHDTIVSPKPGLSCYFERYPHLVWSHTRLFKFLTRHLVVCSCTHTHTHTYTHIHTLVSWSMNTCQLCKLLHNQPPFLFTTPLTWEREMYRYETTHTPHPTHMYPCIQWNLHYRNLLLRGTSLYWAAHLHMRSACMRSAERSLYHC